MVFLLKMVIFYSYVKLPEGKPQNHNDYWLLEEPTPASRRYSFVFNGLSGAPGELQPRASSVPRAPLAQRPQSQDVHPMAALVMGFLPVADVASLSTPWS